MSIVDGDERRETMIGRAWRHRSPKRQGSWKTSHPGRLQVGSRFEHVGTHRGRVQEVGVAVALGEDDVAWPHDGVDEAGRDERIDRGRLLQSIVLLRSKVDHHCTAVGHRRRGTH